MHPDLRVDKPIILLVLGPAAVAGEPLPDMLRKKYGNVEVVESGAAALRRMDQVDESGDCGLDLVIIDAASMRSNAANITRKLRIACDHVPIIHCRGEQQTVPADAGADLYLQRPFTARKLHNRIRALLPPDNNNDVAVTVGDLSLFIDKRSVRVAGKGEFTLTPKLAALLELFMRRYNEVVTRDCMMREVWETDYIGDTRTIDVHVRWIRECIEDNPARPLRLRTVRGKGYMLTAP